MKIKAEDFYLIEKMLADKIYDNLDDKQKLEINNRRDDYRLWLQTKPGLDGTNTFQEIFGKNGVARNYFFKNSIAFKSCEARLAPLRDTILIEALAGLGLRPPGNKSHSNYTSNKLLAEDLYEEFRKQFSTISSPGKDTANDSAGIEHNSEEGQVRKIVTEYYTLLASGKHEEAIKNCWYPNAHDNLFDPFYNNISDINVFDIRCNDRFIGQNDSSCKVYLCITFLNYSSKELENVELCGLFQFDKFRDGLEQIVKFSYETTPPFLRGFRIYQIFDPKDRWRLIKLNAEMKSILPEKALMTVGITYRVELEKISGQWLMKNVSDLNKAKEVNLI